VLQVDKLTEALLDQLYPVREPPGTGQAPQVSKVQNLTAVRL
jgi:hypothetical protein